jgi:hypothetical protein
MGTIGWSALGALAWSASEYAIHRFVGHGPLRARATTLRERLTPSGLAAEFNVEHVAHHANPTYFAPTSHKAAAAAVAVPTVSAALAPFVGARQAFAFALGLSSTYLAYELLHRRIHTHGPTGPYSRWMRRHHLHHHHRTPRANHGVTSPLWDAALGTLEPPARVRVPRAAAPPWMIDPRTGALRADLATDYELVGVVRPAHDAATQGDAAVSDASAVRGS